ncbi:MAG TPA: hypothetical protein VLE43_20560 [Candidatus Saccharimonadia bacterium]|nr:hypothetical protein [Candidatus Saccharimonadia bacterium]
MPIKKLLEGLSKPLRSARDLSTWPLGAHREHWRDSMLGANEEDEPGADNAIACGLKWICDAQDHSSTQDGGVARHYSLLTGWGASYPETTGYIIPTLLTHARLRQDTELLERARRMLDWEVSIQLPSGAFQGGTRSKKKVVPVVFDTGQVLLGLAAGVCEFGEKYRGPMCAAADWLVKAQDGDGAWRLPNPYTVSGVHTWETHVAWGLLEADALAPDRGYREAALKNIRWALGHQSENGWFDGCCLSDPVQPLTHTLGYALRGVVEGYRFTKDPMLLDAALRTAESFLRATDARGRMAGRFDRNWRPMVNWDCLTGSLQVAICWLNLFAYTGDVRMRDAALAVNRFVRSTMRMSGAIGVAGGVKGSFPMSGQYGRFQFLNWACKFMIDSSLLELQLGESVGKRS